MTVIHLSYARIPARDPHRWIEEIDFYAGIQREQSKSTLVKSIHCINYTGIISSGGVDYHFMGNGRWQYFFPYTIHKHIRSLNPDVIIVHGLHFGWQILLLRLQLGGKLKLWVQHHAEKPKKFPKNYFQRLADLFIQGYFFVSNEMALPWIASRQISSITKVFEVMEASSAFTPEQKMLRKSRGEEVVINYLWVGRFDTNKDPDTLLAAFQLFAERHRQVRLYVIYRHELPEEVKKLTDQIKSIVMVGEVAHADMKAWYGQTDFIISTSHYEGSGIAVCEAMSCGCIPLLSNIPSFKKMTDAGACGLLFEPGNIDALLNVLENSLNLDLDEQSAKSLKIFNNQLSFAAIARKINSCITEK